MLPHPRPARAGTLTAAVTLPSSPAPTTMPGACPDPKAILTEVPGWKPEPLTFSVEPGLADHWLIVGIGADAGLTGPAV